MLNNIPPNIQRECLGCFFGALLVVGAMVAVSSARLQADSDGYRQLAENVRNHGVYGFTDGPAVEPTAFRPPLYPILLTLFVRNERLQLYQVAMAHVLIAALTVAGVYAVARSLGLGRLAMLAAGLTAVDPLLLNAAPQVMTELMASALALLAFFALVRATKNACFSTWAFAGAALGLAALCRPTFLATVGVAGVWVLWRESVKGRRVAATHFAALAAAAMLVSAPWIARNTVVLGRPILATTHGGYTILLGNNPSFYAYLRNPSPDTPVWSAQQLDQQILAKRRKENWTELEYDAWANAEARSHIRQDIPGFVRAAAYRCGRLWAVLPKPLSVEESSRRRSLRWGVASYYLIVFLLAAIGMFRLSRGGNRDCAVWIAIFALSFTLLHTMYWCDMRMRAPLSPLLAIAAVSAFARFDSVVRGPTDSDA